MKRYRVRSRERGTAYEIEAGEVAVREVGAAHVDVFKDDSKFAELILDACEKQPEKWETISGPAEFVVTDGLKLNIGTIANQWAPVAKKGEK